MRLDGLNLRDLDLRSYRRQIGVVPQTTILFNGALRENVSYGLENISDDALWKTLTDANLADFFGRHGLAPVVQDRNLNSR